MRLQPKSAAKHSSPPRTGTGWVNRLARRCRKNRSTVILCPQRHTRYGAQNNQGLRVRKHGDANGTGGTTLFVYDLHGTAGGLPSSYPHLIGEYDSSGSPIREYIWLGDTPVAMAMPDVNTPGVPKLFYIHTDHLATPRIVIERSNATLQTLVSGLPLMTQRQNKYAVDMGQISIKRQIARVSP